MKHIFYLFLLGLLTLSCTKDDSIVDELVPAYYPVESKTVGRALDQNGTPIADASVELNGFTAATNSLGLFKFDKMELNGAGTNITVRKLGYFNAFRTFIPNIPTISSITVYMIERPVSGSFAHNTGGTISVNGGGSVTFLPNSIVTSSGATYTGQVVVSAYWIDPTDVNALSVMPGDLRGFSIEGDPVQLATYGMMVVELTTPAGEPLNIGNGITATMTFPVSPSLLTSAPAVMPLWSFNETTGYWEEDGTADIVGNNYVAEVSHFTWYSICGFDVSINVEVEIKNSAGNPVAGASLNFNDPLSLYQGFGKTNNDGIAYAFVQSEKELSFSARFPLFVSRCTEGGYHREIVGPYTESFGWENISITLDPATDLSKTINIAGNFVNCDGDPITDGVLLTSNYNTAFPINADGTINISLQSCEESLELMAYDFETLKESSSMTYYTPDPINNITLTDYSICDNLDEFITVEYDSESFTFVEPFHSASPGEGFDLTHYLSASLNINANFNQVGISWFNNPNDDNLPTGIVGNVDFEYKTTDEQLFGSVTLDISAYDDPGFIIGTYSGNISKVVNGQSTPIVVSGRFRIMTNVF